MDEDRLYIENWTQLGGKLECQVQTATPTQSVTLHLQHL